MYLPLKGEAIEHLAESLKFQMPFKKLEANVSFHSLSLCPKSRNQHSIIMMAGKSTLDSSNNTNDDD